MTRELKSAQRTCKIFLKLMQWLGAKNIQVTLIRKDS